MLDLSPLAGHDALHVHLPRKWLYKMASLVSLVSACCILATSNSDMSISFSYSETLEILPITITEGSLYVTSVKAMIWQCFNCTSWQSSRDPTKGWECWERNYGWQKTKMVFNRHPFNVSHRNTKFQCVTVKHTPMESTLLEYKGATS